MITGTSSVTTYKPPATLASDTKTDATAEGSLTSTSSTDQQDRFLKLLVAQLSNQDPMNPLDNAQMTSQIAQINTVTGITQLNSTVKSMLTQVQSSQALQGAAVVGRDVVYAGDRMTRVGDIAAGAFDLDGAATAVSVQVIAPNGQVLETAQLGAMDSGRHSFSWDASAYSADTNFTFKVTASASGKAVTSTTLSEDKVLGVSTINDVLTLQLANDGYMPYSSVKSIL